LIVVPFFADKLSMPFFHNSAVTVAVHFMLCHATQLQPVYVHMKPKPYRSTGSKFVAEYCF